MADRYVNYDKLLEERHRLGLDEMSKIHKVNAFNHFIDSLPTADVVEVKHGEWIYNTDDFTPKMRCSVCGYNKPIVTSEVVEQEPNDYCNKCGAKMGGGKANDL